MLIDTKCQCSMCMKSSPSSSHRRHSRSHRRWNCCERLAVAKLYVLLPVAHRLDADVEHLHNGSSALVIDCALNVCIDFELGLKYFEINSKLF